MTAVVSLSEVSVVRNRRPIIDRVTWEVDDTQRWVVLGPNGAGKSTLLAIASAQLHPTQGTARVLGEQLGRVDVFELRSRVGLASSASAKRIPDGETVLNTVMTASYGVTGRWNERYDAIDEERAREVLYDWHLESLADRTFGTLSDGERKRAQIARAIMTDPELLLLDEPSASLDLGARERLLQSLTAYASSPYAPAIVMVTHHVEEIPAGITHALLLREGRVVAGGPIEQTLTDALVSETYGIDLSVTATDDGRYTARAV